jgi:hypothetical protein
MNERELANAIERSYDPEIIGINATECEDCMEYKAQRDRLAQVADRNMPPPCQLKEIEWDCPHENNCEAFSNHNSCYMLWAQEGDEE